MDHNAVVREKMTERYLLQELDPTARDEFEEHFFDCPECALDVRAGATFVEQSKIVLAETPTMARVPVRASVRPGWFAWLSPAFAAPALALLLLVVGYQNFVTYPRLRQARHRPETLPWASINIGTYGSSGPMIAKSPGQDFLLFVRIPPDGSYSHYTADLQDSSARKEWSVAIPATSASDEWPIHVPGANLKGGTYTLIICGITSAGESREIGQASFEVQNQ
jgi:hypothetical protein